MTDFTNDIRDSPVGLDLGILFDPTFVENITPELDRKWTALLFSIFEELSAFVADDTRSAQKLHDAIEKLNKAFESKNSESKNIEVLKRDPQLLRQVFFVEKYFQNPHQGLIFQLSPEVRREFQQLWTNSHKIVRENANDSITNNIERSQEEQDDENRRSINEVDQTLHEHNSDDQTYGSKTILSRSEHELQRSAQSKELTDRKDNAKSKSQKSISFDFGNVNDSDSGESESFYECNDDSRNEQRRDRPEVKAQRVQRQEMRALARQAGFAEGAPQDPEYIHDVSYLHEMGRLRQSPNVRKPSTFPAPKHLIRDIQHRFVDLGLDSATPERHDVWIEEITDGDPGFGTRIQAA